MSRTILRATVAAIGFATLGAVALVLAVSRQPGLVFDMDRDPPRAVTAGFYPVERSGDQTFAWTTRRLDIRLSGANRRGSWSCVLRFRGGRADPATQPRLDAEVDGISVASLRATNDFQDFEVPIPAHPAKSGLTVTITSSDVVVPGPSDRRELGVQVDRLSCAPVPSGLAMPPARVLGDAALGAAGFGAAVVLSGLTLGGAAIAGAAVALGQATLLSHGAAPYNGFSRTVLWFAAWSAVLMVVAVQLLERARRRPLEMTARVVIVFSAVAFFLEALGLLHPSKLLIDAVFHAHRFEWVLAGRYYFTQGMPGGVSFPYAIGLYLFAAPWSAFTRDYVALLRVVVCAMQILAGAMLYPMIVRRWDDRLAAVVAVVLFACVPLPFGLVGNANLTNAFGQSAALIAIVAAVTWGFRPPVRVVQFVGLFLLCTLAFVSHVSTFAILAVTLWSAAACSWWFGGGERRGDARILVAVSTLAAVFAVVTYYGHFTDVYLTALRARRAAATAAAPAVTPPAGEDRAAAAPARPVVSLGGRLSNALRLTMGVIGLPILVLAAAGGWYLRAHRARDRLVAMLAAWAIAYAGFLIVGLMRVDAPFERYAAEFVGRVIFATYPAAVIVAASGAAQSWRSGTWGRVGASLLVAAAVVSAAQLWAGWFV